MAKAITLLESTRVDHRAEGDELLSGGLVTIASGDAARIAAWHDEPETGESWRYSGLPPLQVVRGLAAEKLGRPAEALAHHNEAFDVYRPSLWLWPIAALERARLLVEIGTPEAGNAVDELLEVTTRHGLRRWQEKALALKKTLKA